MIHFICIYLPRQRNRVSDTILCTILICINKFSALFVTLIVFSVISY